jgi:beta-1,2-mannobiose phosphorylase / 1,2-beta-oligomannan phosphorylase
MLSRLFTGCLLEPEDVTPSHKALEVVGAFNPGAVAADGDVVLLVRVAERPREEREGYTGLPRWDPGTGLTIDWMSNEDLIFVDPRVVVVKATGESRLTFLSHIVTARSPDGRSVASVGDVRFFPETDYETYGVEDPRITPLEGRYYFTYVAVSKHGAATALASTSDFRSFERHGIVFPPENKDVVLFPERIDGKFVALHRPNPSTHFTTPEIWISRSEDLVHWGEHEPVYGGEGGWETGRVGAGCPPIAAPDGWIEIYHGNKQSAEGVGVYSAGALLLDRADPRIILSQSSGPVMAPESEFERDGFVENVVFPSGVTEHGEALRLYYGAADTRVGVVEYSKVELLHLLRR